MLFVDLKLAVISVISQSVDYYLINQWSHCAFFGFLSLCPRHKDDVYFYGDTNIKSLLVVYCSHESGSVLTM